MIIFHINVNMVVVKCLHTDTSDINSVDVIDWILVDRIKILDVLIPMMGLRIFVPIVIQPPE